MYVLDTMGKKKTAKKLIRPSNTRVSLAIVLCNCIYLWLNQQSIRAATSCKGGRSFHEDLQQARCEIKNAPTRLAKLVIKAGDEKDSKTEAVTTSDSPMDSDLQ